MDHAAIRLSISRFQVVHGPAKKPCKPCTIPEAQAGQGFAVQGLAQGFRSPSFRNPANPAPQTQRERPASIRRG
jgi:hypothetical protein